MDEESRLIERILIALVRAYLLLLHVSKAKKNMIIIHIFCIECEFNAYKTIRGKNGKFDDKQRERKKQPENKSEQQMPWKSRFVPKTDRFDHLVMLFCSLFTSLCFFCCWILCCRHYNMITLFFPRHVVMHPHTQRLILI